MMSLSIGQRPTTFFKAVFVIIGLLESVTLLEIEDEVDTYRDRDRYSHDSCKLSDQ